MTNNEYLEQYLDSCAEEIAAERGKYAEDIPYGDIYADEEIADAVGDIWRRLEEIIEDM